ncbi:virion structural protein [Pseudomonas phage vB_PpuP-Vasula]
MTTKNAPAKVNTIKHKGRKYVIIHRSVTLLLIKRAGKPHHFTLEGGKDGALKRHKDFWAALQHYSDRQDALGIEGHTVAIPAEAAEVTNA